MELCVEAFTPREFSRVPGLGHVIAARHRSWYKKRPFEKALQDIFKDGQLFGNPCRDDMFPTKVAVTSVTNGDQRSIITNYNRRDHIKGVSGEYIHLVQTAMLTDYSSGPTTSI